MLSTSQTHAFLEVAFHEGCPPFLDFPFTMREGRVLHKFMVKMVILLVKFPFDLLFPSYCIVR